MQLCAGVGRFFHIDPVAVADSDHFRYAFRVAGFNYISRKEREAEEKRIAEAKARSGR